jgi:hypothetical protein
MQRAAHGVVEHPHPVGGLIVVHKLGQGGVWNLEEELGEKLLSFRRNELLMPFSAHRTGLGVAHRANSRSPLLERRRAHFETSGNLVDRGISLEVGLPDLCTKFQGQGAGHIDLQRHPDHPRASQGQAPLRPESVEPADQPDGEAL